MASGQGSWLLKRLKDKGRTKAARKCDIKDPEAELGDVLVISRPAILGWKTRRSPLMGAECKVPGPTRSNTVSG